MGRFPIYETGMTLPGTSGAKHRNYDTRTGGEMVGAAMQRLGNTAMDVGLTMYRMQGENELAEANAADKSTIRDMLKRWETNPDETTYQQDFDETWSSEVAAREIKNGWAKRRRSLNLPGLKAGLQQDVVDNAVSSRIQIKNKATEATLITNATQTGNTDPLKAFYDRRVEEKRMTVEERDAGMAKVRHAASQQRNARFVSVDPQWFKDNIKNADDLKEWDKDSIPTDYKWLDGLAAAQLAERKRAQETLTDQQINAIMGVARKQGVDMARIKIGQSDALTESQKAEAMKVAIGAAKLWGDTGVNPWKTTQDYKSLTSTMLKIQSGEIVTMAGVTAEWLKDARANWSYSDYQTARGVLAAMYGGYDNVASDEADPVAAEYVKALQDLWLDKDGQTEDPQGLVVALNDVLTAAKQHANDPNGLEKAVGPVLEKGKDQKAKRLFFGWAAMKKGLGYWWQPRSAFKDLFTGKYMMEEPVPEIQTQAQYDALPKGAAYIDPEGRKRIKG